MCAPLGPAARTLDVVVVDDAFISDLNARYRGKDKPTDVISFSYLDDDAPGDDLAGEVYISHETIGRDAVELGVDVRHLFLRIGVHGALHVLGRDHERADEAERMEREEREILIAHLGEGPAARLF